MANDKQTIEVINGPCDGQTFETSGQPDTFFVTCAWGGNWIRRAIYERDIKTGLYFWLENRTYSY